MKYEKNGFRTPSTKVEIYSQQLGDMGYSPLPTFQEPPRPTTDYPFLLTNGKPSVFFHSALRNVANLRKAAPEPTVQMHPDAAGTLGIGDGNWVFIETEKGKIKQKAELNAQLDPRVIVADADWWFPERGVEKLYGWDESNLNILTSGAPPYDSVVGAVQLRGVPCRVCKI